jgi:arginase family enzyme
MTSMQLLSVLRGLAIQNEVIMIDFVEYLPLLDDRHYNTGILVNRLMRATLAGIYRAQGRYHGSRLHRAGNAVQQVKSS